MITHFTSFDLAFIFSGFALVAGSLIAFAYKKITLSLFLLFCGGFILRLLMAFIDPFVHIWDEQFHAMVARNMLSHPFTPVLYEHPALPFDVSDWTKNHFWVHKPPLFLWQIALAMKIFGIKYWVVRLPSVVLTSFCIPVVFRMGKLVSGEKTGFFAALIFTVVCHQINIVSGFLNTDHNDVIFMCYVLFSFWAWMEFSLSHLKRWILLTGIFSALAILVKWLPGLIIYGAWFVAIVSDKNSRRSLKSWKELFFAFLITLLVAAPWYIYIGIRFPDETKNTFLFAREFSESMGHAGPWWYHFQLLKEDYGWWMILLLPIAFFLFLRNKEKRFLRIGIVAAIFFVYIFYSFVQTRMPLFCLIVSPLIFLMFGEMLEKFQKLMEGKYFRIFFFCAIVFFVYTIFDSGRIESIHTNRDPRNTGYRDARIENKKQFEKAAATLHSPDMVIFNCGGYANGASCMFYTGFTAYNDCPDEKQFRKLKSEGIKMAVFDDVAIPEYMRVDSAVVKLHFVLVRNGF